MALRQPTVQHAPQRVYPAPIAATPPQTASAPTREESEEWVLFSPGSVTDRTYTTSTDHTRTRTAGHSRASDFGSLDTAARSYGYGDYDEGETDDGDEDEELDSLDSHLHEFRAEPSVYAQEREGENSGTVLPTHDGLGSFRVDQTAMGEDVQNHLYAFERFNPRRVKRRRESLDIGQAELENERAAEADRTRRIEQWRSEQSRLLVDEIQKETRRRKQSLSSERRNVVVDHELEDAATLNDVEPANDIPGEENESFWNRLTRRVIRDLMGIDDDLLSIIFGEKLPDDDDLSTTPTEHGAFGEVIKRTQHNHESWEYRLLDRIAKELGLLVNQLSDHPGAFSTYLKASRTPLPYAGLPSIPEQSRRPSIVDLEAASNSVEFRPTLPQAIPAASTVLEREDEGAYDLTREEWERDLDIKMVFRYLRTRFTSGSPADHPTPRPASSVSDAAARAERVRAQHPLVSSPKPKERRRTYRVTVPSDGSVAGSGVGKMRRPGSSSCASERMSAQSWSSRNYWDLQGGSVEGGGSLVVSTGGMGSWGEV